MEGHFPPPPPPPPMGPMHGHGHPGGPPHPFPTPPQFRPMPPPPAPLVYAGFNFTPTNADGKKSWVHPVEQRIQADQEELVKLVKKDPNKPKDTLKKLGAAKKQQVERILKAHNDSPNPPGTEWKLASVFLIEKKERVMLASRTTITKMRVILMRVPISHARHDSLPGPVPTPHLGGHAQPPPIMPPHSFPPRQPPSPHDGMFGGMPPPPPMHHGRPPSPFRPGPSPMHQPQSPGFIMNDLDGQGDFDDRHHKKQHRSRSPSPKIRIPALRTHSRHDSRNSSRPTSGLYDSDTLSHDSIPTPFSGSNDGWNPNSKRRYSHNKDPKRYRDRRGSTGSNDSFVLIPHSSKARPHRDSHSAQHHHQHRHKHSSSGGAAAAAGAASHTSSQRSGSIESWNRAVPALYRSSTSIRRDSDNRGDREYRSIVREMEAMQMSELEHLTEQKLERDHKMEMTQRLEAVETMLHDDAGMIAAGGGGGGYGAGRVSRYVPPGALVERPFLGGRAYTEQLPRVTIGYSQRAGRHRGIDDRRWF